MFQDGNNTGIEVPAEVMDALGAGKRPPVVVNVNGFEYRSTIASMGGKFLIPFSAARREESGRAPPEPGRAADNPATAPVHCQTCCRARRDCGPAARWWWPGPD